MLDVGSNVRLHFVSFIHFTDSIQKRDRWIFAFGYEFILKIRTDVKTSHARLDFRNEFSNKTGPISPSG